MSRILKVACLKMALSVCDYSQATRSNSIPVSVIACILDFNNGVEYYQTVNTLITSLVLWLFDNSIFHCRLLCLMPLRTREQEEEWWLHLEKKSLFDCILHPLFLISFIFQQSFSFHSTCNVGDRMAVALEQSLFYKELPVPVVKQETFWLIFSICLAGFELKLDGHLDRTALTLVSPPGQSDTHTLHFQGGGEAREGWLPE